MGPEGLMDLAAAVMLGVASHAAALLAANLRTGGRASRDVHLSHLVMGIAMAGMFVPSLAFGSARAWELVFSVLLVWFAARVVTSLFAHGPHVPHAAIHAVMSAAMLIMLRFPAGVGSTMSGMANGSSAVGSGAHLGPGIGLALAAVFCADAIAALATEPGGQAMFGARADVAVAAVASGPPEHGPTRSPVRRSVAHIVTSRRLADTAHAAMAVAMGLMLVLML